MKAAGMNHLAEVELWFGDRRWLASRSPGETGNRCCKEKHLEGGRLAGGEASGFGWHVGSQRARQAAAVTSVGKRNAIAELLPS